MTKAITHKRVNITLPPETVRLIDRIAEKGERSRLLDEAVRFYVHAHGRAKLSRLLREGSEKRAERDLALAQEWFSLEQEVWRKKRGK